MRRERRRIPGSFSQLELGRDTIIKQWNINMEYCVRIRAIYIGGDFLMGTEPLVIYMDDGLPRYVCPQCGVKYKKVSALKAHRKECGKGAQCPLCPKIVTQKRNLAKHMERHAKDGLLDHYLQSAIVDEPNYEKSSPFC
ncbi:uncharacterized protein LOC132260654 [Phlebotomus argentipes]|uniref:uncharacterized protein LOC132260654 n=1 Tax=Phlebotomus argentipes TaxID=94469 RepID=UPI002892F579|nr:uncharacterized protein LOC132260654 [Phlebotomus argentipes]